MVEADKTQQLDVIPLYRYMTFDKFLKTLDQGLFIPKASLLEDRWEGMMWFMHDFLKEQKVSTLADWCIPGNHKSIREGMKEVYVSCWNKAYYECVAMWKLYGKGENAVMLETSAKELNDAFVNFDNSKEWLACLIKLRYVLPGDWRDDKIFNGEEPFWNRGFYETFSVHPRFHFTYTGLHYKHKSYTFEHEYRLLAAHKNRGERPNDGIVLPLKKSSFIKRVILQPDSSDIFQGVVQDCLKKNNFNDVPVEKSFLDKLPPLEE